MFIRNGLMIRLTGNLDKTRGFVNGALAEVVDVLSETQGKGVAVFSARLTTGAMILVHPIRVEGKVFLPCCYGYATTIRRSQGSSLWLGALWFDHCYPPERGYGYVGASRFRNRDGLYHYGKVRRTDWIPVGKVQDDWELRRSGDSVSSSSGRGSDNEDDGFDCYEGGDTDSESGSSDRDSRSTEADSEDGDPGDYWDDADKSEDGDDQCGQAAESNSDGESDCQGAGELDNDSE